MNDKEKQKQERKRINERVLNQLGRLSKKKESLVLCPDGVMRTEESYKKWMENNTPKGKVIKFPAKG